MIPELMLRCLTIDSYSLCGNVRKLCVRKDDKALYKSRIISCPASALSRQRSAQLFICLPTLFMHKPIDIRASSGSVFASFRSILLHSDQIKFQNEERLPAIRPLCCACLPLLSACRTGTHKHPVYVSKFIYLWFVLYYNILEQLKLYNGPCMLGLSFSLYP